MHFQKLCTAACCVSNSHQGAAPAPKSSEEKRADHRGANAETISPENEKNPHFQCEIMSSCMNEAYKRYFNGANHQGHKSWPQLQVVLQTRRPLRGFVIKSFDLLLNSEWLKQSHSIKHQIYWTALTTPDEPFRNTELDRPVLRPTRQPVPNFQQYLAP